MATEQASLQGALFSLVVTIASRAFQWRDRMFRRSVALDDPRRDVEVSRHAIPSGRNRLDAVFISPSLPRAKLLICHGIGETVEHWRRVQQMLAANGVASLVFDYSGYGRSTGVVRASQCEQDAVAAFRFLQGLGPELPISLLGFSLGTGIAAAVLPGLTVKRLVLCAAYTSIHAAARQVGIPNFLRWIVLPVWDTEAALRSCSVPVLIVHGERDPLFPVAMAEALFAACVTPSKLVVVPGLDHDSPYYRPEPGYWEMVAAELKRSV